MKYRIHWILLLLALPVFPLYSQGLRIEAGAGIATVRMDDLKYYQEFLLKNYPVPGKVVSSFPPYMSVSARIGKEIIPSIWLGAGYTLTSSGGRINYTDYSGSITTDMQAGSHQLCARIAYIITGNDRYDLTLYGEGGLNYTRLGVSTSLYVMGYSDGSKNLYRSATACGSAGIAFTLHFNDFSVGIEGGYLVDGRGKLTNTNTGADLTDPSDPGRQLTTDWTGWRTQLKLSISL
jgi:hypothetical protein